MRALSIATAAFALSVISVPASAQVVGASNLTLSSTPTVFNIAPGVSFGFSYNPSGSFDANPFFVQTSGTANVSAFGGFLGIPLQPSQFFTRANAEFGPDSFINWAPFTDLTAIPNSLSPGDLGLRYQVGSDFFYGYARTEGNSLTIAFETMANTAINGGDPITGVIAAVPEPATWAMMIGGFGMIGGALRRRRAITGTMRLA